jgi:hypothetical protein
MRDKLQIATAEKGVLFAMRNVRNAPLIYPRRTSPQSVFPGRTYPPLAQTSSSRCFSCTSHQVQTASG